jgi:hypothetical protein
MRDLFSDLTSVLDALAAVDVHDLPEPAALIHTEAVLDAKNRMSAIAARALQSCDVRDVTVNECGRTTKSWLIEEQHLSPKDAGRQMWVARRLPTHPAIADALGAAEINHEHARVIIGCLMKLSADWREAAEAELIAFARDHDPAMLSALCREIRVRSGADEDAEAAAQRKYDSRYLTMNSTMDGMVHVDGLLDPESAATINAALTPLMGKATVLDVRTTAQHRADALVELARLALGFGDLPDHGGERPQVMVTIPLAELLNGIDRSELGHAMMNGREITPATARMVACDANIIPAVLSGRSEVLDLGRSQPTWSRAQRRAGRLEDQGCTWPSCQAGLERCQIHHIDEVANGGPTDKDNGTHICHFHHWLVHHSRWRIWRNAEGRIEVSRT